MRSHIVKRPTFGILTTAIVLTLTLVGTMKAAAGALETIHPAEAPVPSGAVIVVTSTDDDLEVNGNCTLREAIQAANSDTAVDACIAGSGDDVIQLGSATYSLSLGGQSEDDNQTGDLDIRSTLTISGVSAGQSIIDALQIDRVLHVHQGATVFVQGITIQGGRPSQTRANPEDECPVNRGGGILNEGSLTLSASTVTNNAIASAGMECVAGSGGGLYNSGALTVTDTTINNNSAADGVDLGEKGGNGGGLANAGLLTLHQTTIIRNSAGLSGGVPRGPALIGGDGGGLFSSGVMTVTSSTIAENRTNDGGQGGGIFSTGTAVLSQTGVYSNQTGLIGHGGGIFNSGSIEIDRSAVYENQTGDGIAILLLPTPVEYAGGSGGGIYNTGSLTLTQVTVSRNRTGKRALTLSAGDGAGVANLGTSEIEASTIAANLTGATGSCFEPSCAEGATGGGIFNDDAAGSLSLHNTILANNYAATGSDCRGTITLMGHNLIQQIAGCTLTNSDASDQLNRLAWLEPLDDNGGPTPTHALLGQSAALNNGSCESVSGETLTIDQRGEPRPQGEGCDIGAFESPLAPLPVYNLYLPKVTTLLQKGISITTS